jgi:ABC-type antimicrobial peptide transport system permease subunit
VPVRDGRPFTGRDDRDAPPVVLINETLARRCCAGFDPIGQVTTRGTVVGIVGDVRQASLDRPAEPELYFPIAQNWSQVSDLGMTLVVKAAGSVSGLPDLVRPVVRDVNPDLAVFNVKTMDEVVADSLAEFRLYLSIVTAFAVVALILVLTGAFGVISYVAAARTKEFAVRVALGAGRGRIARLVVARGAVMAVAGLAIGTLGALAAGSLVSGLPVDVRPPDAVTLLAVSVVLLAVALAASVVPAARAAGVDPVRALKDQ